MHSLLFGMFLIMCFVKITELVQVEWIWVFSPLLVMLGFWVLIAFVCSVLVIIGCIVAKKDEWY